MVDSLGVAYSIPALGVRGRTPHYITSPFDYACSIRHGLSTEHDLDIMPTNGETR